MAKSKKSAAQLDREIAQALSSTSTSAGSSRKGERLADSRYKLADAESGDVVRTATADEIARYRTSKGKTIDYTDRYDRTKPGYIGRLYEDADENQYLVDLFDE